MIDTPARFSDSTLAYANETFTHCIQHMLLRWFNLPNTVPEHEAAELRADIERMMRLLLTDLEMNMPEMQRRLVLEMGGLADLLASLAAPFEKIDSHTDMPVLKLVFSDVNSTLPLSHAQRSQRGSSR